MDIKEDINEGKIFVYPTDTIYGIGCDATNELAVEKIKDLKKRDREKPLSIIAPSKKWIKNNCIVEDSVLEKYLPGPYTLILKKKDANFLAWCAPGDSLGVRIPDNDFTKRIQESKVPFITTSVNISGEKFPVKVSEMPKEILGSVDQIVDVGELSGRPSTLVIDGKEIKR